MPRIVSSSTVAASPATSLNWSSIDDVYTANLAAATQEIQDFLNSPHNTWNLPSPTDSRHTSPAPAPIFVPGSPPPFIDNQTFLDVLADIATQELTRHNLDDLIIELTHPATVNDQDFVPANYRLLNELSHPISPVPDNTPDIIKCQPLLTLALDKDIPIKNLPLPIVVAPVATIPSLAPPSPTVHAVAPILPTYMVNTDTFPRLFTPLPCTNVQDEHPHQFIILYERLEKIWVPQHDFLGQNFLSHIPQVQYLDNHPAFFVTPFRSSIYHHVPVPSSGALPSVHICAQVGHHPPALSFPFGYLESSFVHSISCLFSQFPPAWLKYFKGALVPLVAYDFLDGRLATIVGHLHFTEAGTFVINRSTRTEDLIRTQPGLFQFVCTPHIPTNPFLHITPPLAELPL